MKRLLIVEDKESLALMLKETVESEGLEADLASNGSDAMRRLAEGRRYLAVVTDLRLPGSDGIAVLKQVKESDPECPVIVMTAYGTIDNAVEAMKLGAFDFIQKPLDVDHLILLLRRCREHRELRHENLLLKEEFQTRYGLPSIIGESPSIVGVSQSIQRVAPTDSTVLLQGESGTGKEVFARAIHPLSSRRDSRHAHRERIVRTRERLVHGCDGAPARKIRARRLRHHLPRRDRRPWRRRTVETPARAAGAQLRAHRRHVASRCRRARDLRDESQSRRRRQERPVSRRPVLPRERFPRDHSAAARAQRRRRRADRFFFAAIRARAWEAFVENQRRRARRASRARLAGQHPRAGELHRARGNPVRRQHDRASGPVPRAFKRWERCTP